MHLLSVSKNNNIFNCYFYLIGVVTLDGSLSFAKNTNVKFVVNATDNGQPPMSSTETVYITLLNTNNYSPVFAMVIFWFDSLPTILLIKIKLLTFYQGNSIV